MTYDDRNNPCIHCNGTGFVAGVLDEPCDNCSELLTCEICAEPSTTVNWCPYCMNDHSGACAVDYCLPCARPELKEDKED